MIVQAQSAHSVTTGSLLSHSFASADFRVAAKVVAVLFAAMLTAAAAQFTSPLPFIAVPFTLAPLAVMLTGAALGPRLGFLSQALYLAAGAAGLAVFAPSITLPAGAGRLIGRRAVTCWHIRSRRSLLAGLRSAAGIAAT
jgi:hypothetical protein